MNARNLLLVSALSLSLVACGGKAQEAPSSNTDGADNTVATETADTEETSTEKATVKDFDGSGLTETGDFTFFITTPGGTSENGNIPQVAASADMLMQIGYEIRDGDGSICTFYIDGMEVQKVNAGDSQGSLNISGDTITEGVHTVELVQMDGDKPVIYKSAQYEIVY